MSLAYELGRFVGMAVVVTKCVLFDLERDHPSDVLWTAPLAIFLTTSCFLIARGLNAIEPEGQA